MRAAVVGVDGGLEMRFVLPRTPTLEQTQQEQAFLEQTLVELEAERLDASATAAATATGGGQTQIRSCQRDEEQEEKPKCVHDGREEEEEKEEERSICRICYEDEEECAEGLISPCSCMGSLRYVHASCLNKWRALNISNEKKSTCQLCLQRYRLEQKEDDVFWTWCTKYLSSWIRHRDDRDEQYRFFTRQRVYNISIYASSLTSMFPLAVLATAVSTLARNNNKDVGIVGEVDEVLWDRDTFKLLVGENLIKEINTLIELGAFPIPVTRAKRLWTWRACLVYGLTKLGAYGCTWWLFTDGLSDAIPRAWNARWRSSPVFLALKAVVEFVLIPQCLRTPTSRYRLPPFLLASSIGIVFILHKMQTRIRSLFVDLFPQCEEYELGRLARD